MANIDGKQLQSIDPNISSSSEPLNYTPAQSPKYNMTGPDGKPAMSYDPDQVVIFQDEQGNISEAIGSDEAGNPMCVEVNEFHPDDIVIVIKKGETPETALIKFSKENPNINLGPLSDPDFLLYEEPDFDELNGLLVDGAEELFLKPEPEIPDPISGAEVLTGLGPEEPAGDEVAGSLPIFKFSAPPDNGSDSVVNATPKFTSGSSSKKAETGSAEVGSSNFPVKFAALEKEDGDYSGDIPTVVGGHICLGEACKEVTEVAEIISKPEMHGHHNKTADGNPKEIAVTEVGEVDSVAPDKLNSEGRSAPLNSKNDVLAKSGDGVASYAKTRGRKNQKGPNFVDKDPVDEVTPQDVAEATGRFGGPGASMAAAGLKDGSSPMSGADIKNAKENHDVVEATVNSGNPQSEGGSEDPYGEPSEEKMNA